MRKRSKILLGMLGATILLAASVSTASATRLESSSQSIRASWAQMIFRGFGASVTCRVTLEGTLHSRTIVKTNESLIGYITRVIVREETCTGGTARALSETLPWHVRYRSFEGPLPGITAINTNVIGAKFRVGATVFGTNVFCLYTTTVAQPNIGSFAREGGGALTSVAVSGTIRSSGEFGCSEGTLSGSSESLTVLGGTTRITVRLIA